MKNRKIFSGLTEAENKQNMEASGWIWCNIGASSGNYGRNGRRIYSKNKQRNFSSGNSCSNDTGDAELYFDQKVCGKEKLDTPVPEQKYGAAEKEAAVYSEDQKESGTLSGSNADDSRKELKDQKISRQKRKIF